MVPQVFIIFAVDTLEFARDSQGIVLKPLDLHMVTRSCISETNVFFQCKPV